MAVITISRQMGSLGCQVAEEISRCLNYRLVWREVINQAALRAGVPEVALATIDELNLLSIRPSQEDRSAYHSAVRELMKEYAGEGDVVIVGRAGQVILHDHPDALHVKVYAPFHLRVARVAEKHSLPPEAARIQVEKSDQARTRYLKRYYQARWDDPGLYDLMLSTAQFDPKMAAEIICSAISRLGEGRKTLV